jgi:hypothetical protein
MPTIRHSFVATVALGLSGLAPTAVVSAQQSLPAQKTETGQPVAPTPAALQEAAWRQSEPWQQFVRQHGSNWQVEWSPATATPKAIWGQGIDLPDWRDNSLEEARRQANHLLLDQAAMLGIDGSEFREIIGARMHRVWTFQFRQYHAGLEVIGGRADVRVHMVGRVPMIGSTFWPIPDDFVTTPSFDAGTAWMIAWQQLASRPTGVKQPNEASAPRLVIWGDITAADLAEVHLAWEVPISNVDAQGNGPIGRYYVDARAGKVLHYVNDKHECGLAGCFGGVSAQPAVAVAMTTLPTPVATTVTVMGWTRTGVDALSPLANVPMPGLEINVPGIGTMTTDDNGQFTIDIAATTTINVNGLDGRHHGAISGASAPTGSYTVNPGQAATIQLLNSGASTNQAAHTTASYFVDATNEFSRSILGNTTQLDTASNIAVNVNIASTCNAYYTGNSINFYQSGGGCSNTAFSTVVAHEWGHGIDERYGGISNTSSEGLSEGWGDIFGCYLLDTPDLGSGFQSAGVPLRSGNNSVQYPCTGCGVHTAGQSWMGFAWKLRERLALTYGNRATAIAISNNIVISTIAADAIDQPGAVREVFIADDNDGDLTNGTPNYDDLVWACDQHSLPYPGQSSSVPNDECSGAIALANGVNGPFSSAGAFTSSPGWNCALGGSDVWFAYTAGGSGTLTVSTCSQANYDSALEIFSGSCGSLSSIACNDDACSLQSTVSVSVTAGTYYIRVGGYNGASGSFSLDVSGPASTPPSTPSGLIATAAGDNQIDLLWSDNSNNESSYEVERSPNGVSFSLIASLPANATGYSDGGLAAGSTWSYRVRAVNGAGGSGYSNTASATTTQPTPPSAPSGLGATAASTSQINLGWTDNADNETGYDVERSTDGSNFSLVTTLSADATSYSDIGRAAGTTYWYRVRAVNAAGNSGYSNTASATTPQPTPPAAPSGLGAAAAGSDRIDLSWSDNANDETSFEVERSTDGSNFSPLTSRPANVSSYSDTGLQPNTTYWYRVRATNSVGASGWSNTASATTQDNSGQSFQVVSELFGHGVITGSYTLTQADDGQYQELRERTANRRNSLQHEWRFANVPSTGTRTLRVQAFQAPSGDNDNFRFQVRSGRSWVTAMTVSKQSDDGAYQEYVLPSGVSGTVRLRVIDTDNTRSAVGDDTLFVDHIEIVAQ